MESRQRLGELTSQLRVSAVRLENADDLSVEHRIQMGRDVLYTLQRTTMVLKKARTLIWAAKVPKVAIKTVQDTLIYIDELARTAVSITAPAVEEDLRIYAQELAKTTKQADDAQIDVGDYESLKTAKASPDKTLGRTLESARALPERLLLTPDLTEGESTASKNEFSSDEAHEDKAETASALMAFPPVVGGGAQSLERVEYIPTGRMLEIEDLATPDAERTLRGAVRLTRDRLLDHTSVDKAFTNRYRETKRRGRSKGGRSTWDRLAGDCYLDRLRREQRRRTGRPNMSLRETIRALEGFDELIYAMTPYSAEVSSSPAHGPVTETVSATERQESTESSEPVVKLNSKDEFIYPIAPVDTIVEDDSHPKTKALTKTSISALGSEDLDFANDGNQELSSETLVETAFVGRSPSKSRSETSNSGPKLAQDNLVDAEIAVRLADARRGLALAKYARASEPNPGYALMRRRATIERMRLSDALTAKHLGNELVGHLEIPHRISRSAH